MNKETELRLLNFMLIVFGIGLFLAAVFSDGAINKIGFTLFSIYVLWTVFKKTR